MEYWRPSHLPKVLLSSFALLVVVGTVWTFDLWRGEAQALREEAEKRDREYRRLEPIERLRINLTQLWDTARYDRDSHKFELDWIPVRPKPSKEADYAELHRRMLDSLKALVFVTDSSVQMLTVRTDSLRPVRDGRSIREAVLESTVRREE